jgi:hypothetical protein
LGEMVATWGLSIADVTVEPKTGRVKHLLSIFNEYVLVRGRGLERETNGLCLYPRHAPRACPDLIYPYAPPPRPPA